MKKTLNDAFIEITNHCRKHYRVGARCEGCEITWFCENRNGFPKDFMKQMNDKNK